jgi:enterochelin esterase-like enzyme
MNFINPPATSPEYVTHKTFYSKLINTEIGYNIYLPPDYSENGKRYPVEYYLHGYGNNESWDIWTLEKVYKSKQAITVFANSGPTNNGYRGDNELPVVSIIINELIPHIDAKYRTDTNCGNRSISGFSMGGAGALDYAVKYPDLFSSVTAYAGAHDFDLYIGEDFNIYATSEQTAEIYENIFLKDPKYFDNGVFYLLKQNKEKICDKLQIKIHIGTSDILFCINEILHRYLNALNIPHEYKIFEGIGHELGKII